MALELIQMALEFIQRTRAMICISFSEYAMALEIISRVRPMTLTFISRVRPMNDLSFSEHAWDIEVHFASSPNGIGIRLSSLNGFGIHFANSLNGREFHFASSCNGFEVHSASSPNGFGNHSANSLNGFGIHFANSLNGAINEFDVSLFDSAKSRNEFYQLIQRMREINSSN